MSKFVKWTLSNQYTTERGEMPIENIPKCLEEFRAAALNYQKESDADHIVYAAKHFDTNGELIRMRFYENFGLDDETFNRRVNACKNYQVYAIHKRG